MKAISLWQPWASAIAVGAKRYETRSWPAVAGGQRFAGWLAIHASKREKYPKEEGGNLLSETFDELLDIDGQAAELFSLAHMDEWKDLPLGSVVAVGWLKASHYTIDPRLDVSGQERLWGNYSAGRYAWEFSEAWRLNTPLAMRGDQKLFNITMPANWQDQATKVF